MQEEIEQKTFNIMISTTKLSARTVLRAVKAALRLYQSKASQGKQSVRTLLRQNRGVSSVEISKTGIRGWNAMPKSTASTTPSARTPPRCRPGIWSFSKPRTQKPFNRRSRSIRHLCSTRTNAPRCWHDCRSWCRRRQNSPAKSGTRNRSVDCDHEKADKAAGAVSALSSAGLVATNFGEAWRLAEGKELGDKIMSMMGTIPLAFANPLPSLHPLDLLVGLCCGAGLRLAVYLRGKNAKKYRHGMEYGSARWSA